MCVHIACQMSFYHNIFMDIPSTKLVDDECEYTKQSWQASKPADRLTLCAGFGSMMASQTR
jgi:hypothetical protein